MIQIEHIIDDNKSLLKILFNDTVMEHMSVKCDDNLNFFQSTYRINQITLFKSDTGYRITRTINQKKTYEIKIKLKNLLPGIGGFELTECIYFLKKNGFVRCILQI